MGGPVAPLVQALSAGIQAQGDAVLHDGKADLHRLGALIEPSNMVAALEPLHHGLFDDLLAVGHGKELGVETVTRDGEGGVLGNPALPGQGLGLLEERIKGLRLKAPDFQKHSLAGAQAQIGTDERSLVSGEGDSSVLGGDFFHIHAAQLVCCQTFQPE